MRKHHASNYGGQYVQESKEIYQYDGTDKGQWNLFMAEREHSMMEEKLTHLDDTNVIVQRLKAPAPCQYIPYISDFEGEEETRAQKEESAFRQRRAEKAYDAAHEKWQRDTITIMGQYGQASVILMKHVS